jgi:tetrahydromethanopterin S-methyltransferase subunit G
MLYLKKHKILRLGGKSVGRDIGTINNLVVNNFFKAAMERFVTVGT